MMGFLVEAFACLKDLQPFVPRMESLHQPEKSQVIPMKILFTDNLQLLAKNVEIREALQL
jgi:hypothetical protein